MVTKTCGTCGEEYYGTTQSFARECGTCLRRKAKEAVAAANNLAYRNAFERFPDRVIAHRVVDDAQKSVLIRMVCELAAGPHAGEAAVLTQLARFWTRVAEEVKK